MSMIKYLMWFMMLVAVVFLIYFLVQYAIPSKQLPTIKTKVDTVVHSYHVYYHDRKDSVLAKIDTVYIANAPNIIAKYHDLIKKDKIAVELGIEYNETSDRFNVETDITGTVDSVFTTITKTEYRYKRPKFISPIIHGAYLQKLDDPNNNTFQAGAGFRLFGKIDLIGIANTDKYAGIGISLSF